MIKTLAVMTSGGDSPGMNAAVRAVVRRALDRGIEVYGIFWGYEGLLQGGKLIRPLGWQEVGDVLQHGGTFLGTARSAGSSRQWRAGGAPWRTCWSAVSKRWW